LPVPRKQVSNALNCFKHCKRNVAFPRVVS
jgi:hypothetical protein